MALVVEDGSIVAGANSLATVAEIREYAAARGIATPPDDLAVEIAAIKAMDYVGKVEAEGRLNGDRTDPANQELPFPRVGLSLYGLDVDPNSIPKPAKLAQIKLSLDVLSGIDLTPSAAPSQAIKRERVEGVTETEYFAPPDSLPTLTLAEAYLEPLMVSGGFSLTVMRA